MTFTTNYGVCSELQEIKFKGMLEIKLAFNKALIHASLFMSIKFTFVVKLLIHAFVLGKIVSYEIINT